MKNAFYTFIATFIVSFSFGQALDDLATLYEEGDYQEVLEKMDGMIFDPGSYEIFKLRGDCFHKVDDFENAIINYDLAEKLEDYNVDLYVDRAAAYMGISNYDSASKGLGKSHEGGQQGRTSALF